MSNFQKKYSYKDRVDESIKIRIKYPNRIPVIIEKYPSCDLPDIDKTKYLMPMDLTMSQVLYVIRKRIKITPDKAIFIFVNNTLCPSGDPILNVYEQYKNPDGFLYITYSTESVFGA